MPLPFLLTSSDGFVGGGQYTRFKGAILGGTYTGTTSAGTPSEGVSGVGLVQPGTVVSTLGNRTQVLSTLTAAITAANYIYIPQTTGAVVTTSFAAGEGAPPLTGMGAALLWDAGRQRIGIYSTVAGSWLFMGNSTSTTFSGTVFTSS